MNVGSEQNTSLSTALPYRAPLMTIDGGVLVGLIDPYQLTVPAPTGQAAYLNSITAVCTSYDSGTNGWNLRRGATLLLRLNAIAGLSGALQEGFQVTWLFPNPWRSLDPFFIDSLDDNQGRWIFQANGFLSAF